MREEEKFLVTSNFSFSHSIFTCTADTLTYLPQYPLLTTLIKKAFKNIVEKGENAGNQHFLLFPQCFLPFPKEISIF